MQNKSLLLDTIDHKKNIATPIWLMRQAGRYLPEYRATRAQAGSFMNLCKNPDLACEVTLQPIKRFAFDAAILFSDILTIPDALGLELNFIENEGPCFNKKISSAQDFAALDWNNAISKLSYVFDAVKLIKTYLPHNIPLIGFAGSPWTLACYMLEGKSSATYEKIKSLTFNDPEIIHNFLAKIAEQVTLYLEQQIIAGTDLIMLFDTWGGILSENYYLNFSLYYMKIIIENLKKKYKNIPIILFSKGVGASLQKIQQLAGPDVIGLDWVTSASYARSVLGNKQVLQGNLDPFWLTIDNKKLFAKEVKSILESQAGLPHIMNLGHGITPNANINNIHWLIDLVRLNKC